MAQLVDEHITLINTMTNTRLDREGVKAKFDVWPEQIIDYLALVGDSSDNIPGIDKVGPKTAAKWLQAYGTVDELVRHADEIPGEVGENLRAGLDTLALSRQLATIRVDLDLPGIDAEFHARAGRPGQRCASCTRGSSSAACCKQLDGAPAAAPAAGRIAASRNAGFRSGALRVPDAAAAPLPPRSTRHYATILTQAQLDDWLAAPRSRAARRLRHRDHQPRLSRGAHRRRLVLHRAGHAAYLPLAHRYAGAPEQLDLDAMPRAAEALARGRDARQARPSPEVRRARARQPRHHARAACATTRCSSPTC